jgi:hypothetical protein
MSGPSEQDRPGPAAASGSAATADPPGSSASAVPSTFHVLPAPPVLPVPSAPSAAESAGALERRVAEWVGPYSQAWHLVRARDWLVHLDPDATPEMRVAALSHDIERYYPGGPRLDMSKPWDHPDYLFAHSTRSADIVAWWLREQPDRPDDDSIYRIRRLIAMHEIGGLEGADLVQAADSLSFLETLTDLVRGWVVNGQCDVATAEAKHRYMAERIRVPQARELAEPLLANALAVLHDQAPAAGTTSSTDGSTPA